MDSPINQPPLSDLQQKLIQLISTCSEEELEDIRMMLVQYFGKKATEEADRVWDEKGWNDERVDELLNDPNQ